jgi:hypothetical protein
MDTCLMRKSTLLMRTLLIYATRMGDSIGFFRSSSRKKISASSAVKGGYKNHSESRTSPGPGEAMWGRPAGLMRERLWRRRVTE